MERRLFEDLVESDVVAKKGRKGRTLPVSVAVHIIVLIAVVVVPLLSSGELPEPTTAVKAFFVEPAAPATTATGAPRTGSSQAGGDASSDDPAVHRPHGRRRRNPGRGH